MGREQKENWLNKTLEVEDFHSIVRPKLPMRVGCSNASYIYWNIASSLAPPRPPFGLHLHPLRRPRDPPASWVPPVAQPGRSRGSGTSIVFSWDVFVNKSLLTEGAKKMPKIVRGKFGQEGTKTADYMDTTHMYVLSILTFLG